MESVTKNDVHIRERTDRQVDVSFCIPVYNVAPWVEKCIESILSIGDEISYEIICVDDCSTDNSLEVLQNLSKSNRIKVLQNDENRGLPFTRNVALSNAVGRYIWFVDSDDMIESHSVKKLVDIADNDTLDYVFGNYEKFKDEIVEHKNDELDYFICCNDRRNPNWLKTLPHEINTQAQMRSVWAGIYRHEFLKKYNILFTEGISMCEDIAFNYLVEVNFASMAKYNGVVYYYRTNPTSLCHSFSAQKRKRVYNGAKIMYSLYNNYLIDGVYSKDEYGFVPKNTLLMRLSRLQQNIITNLAAVDDTGFIQIELKNLKQQNLYPYKLKKDILLESGKSFRNILFYLAAFEPFFWLLHFMYKLYYRNSK